MRKEPYSLGSYVHVINRGQRKQPIVLDDADRWRFLKMLAHFNDEKVSPNWPKDIDTAHPLKRPQKWAPKKPLVDILAFCLMPNHFHLILREIIEQGISRFMQGLGTGMSNAFNTKYETVGSLFQGSFKSRTIETDHYFRYLASYVMVKNPLELYPGGLEKAVAEFDKSYNWALNYPFSSLNHFIQGRDEIITPGFLGEIFVNKEEFKMFCLDSLEGRKFEFLGIDNLEME